MKKRLLNILSRDASLSIASLAMRALIDPGDEVIYATPCFVSYPAEVLMARGGNTQKIKTGMYIVP